MYIVNSNKAQYEYDIHSLVKAFFPGEDVKVLTPDSVIKDKSLYDIEPDFTLDFEDTRVTLGIFRHVYEWVYDGCPTGPKGSLISDSLPAGKDGFKRFLYLALCHETGKTLPWGDLIGIRPTKIAMTMLEAGKDESDIRDFLKNNHYVSDEKISLATDIARREKSLLDRLHKKDGYSIYIGIPFCPTTCLYCSFTSFPISVWKDRVSDYLEALFKEIDFVADFYRDKIIDSIYIGGGTPSSLSAEELDRLLTKIDSSLDLSCLLEYTVEAGRADSITEDKLKVLYKHGVGRISVNPQTMRQKTLDLIGRRHTVEQVIEAFNTARRIGFDNINMDIILGLPGEDEEDVAYTIGEISKLNPDSLTVHSLAIKRASKLSSWIEDKDISILHNTDKTMEIASDGARSMEMYPYYLYRQKNMSGNFENVGYAREGKFGIYNILIMEEVQTIIALGAGSITKRVFPDGRIERCDNVKDVTLYIEKIDEMIQRKKMLLY